MDTNIVQNSFIVIGNYCDEKYSFEDYLKYYINKYDKIFILGNVTEWFDVNRVENGVEFLENIKKLCEQYSDRIIYIPGICDYALYLYGYSKYGYVIMCSESFPVYFVNKLRKNDLDRLNSLMTWLGNLPIQRVHDFNGQRYVLANAFFNKTLYEENPNYSLNDMENLPINEKYNKLFCVLCSELLKDWYMVLNDYGGNNYDEKDVPSDVIEIIGNVPNPLKKKLNLNLKNVAGGVTKVFCADGVACVDDILSCCGKNYTEETSSHTYIDNLFLENSNVQKKQGLFYTLVAAIKETTRKHGLDNTKNILKLILRRNPNWYSFFSRGNRDKLKQFEIDKVIRTIKFFADNVDDEDEIIEIFIDKLYDRDEEFADIVDGFNVTDTSQISDFLKKEEQKDFDFILLHDNKQPIIIYRINNNQMEVFIKELIKKFGKEMVSKSILFDYNDLIKEINFEQAVQLGNTEYILKMNIDGNIIIIDGTGKIVDSFSSNSSFVNYKHI